MVIVTTILIYELYVLFSVKQRHQSDSDKYGELLKEEKLKFKLSRQREEEAPKDLPYQVENAATQIDWHDWEQIETESKRLGVGEQGVAVKIKEDEVRLDRDSYNSNGFSGYVSDKISIERAVPDIRHPMCKVQKYSANLPSVSVIIPYHNEHWTTLMRTVHSVVNRSPEELLTEVILVDDASTKEHCKEAVDKYVKDKFQNVRVIHLTKRAGLIGARLSGARSAIAPVLFFLDSHTEANVNWLPPLLEPIAQNERTAVCPFIDVVAYDTFEYRAQDEGARGAFDWELYYKRLPLLPQDLANPTQPFNNPVMAGGLFAIPAKFFWELGGYDEGLQIWGGEQYELSFKIWQCGGRLLDAPCSRVGHIYRKFAPFNLGGSLGRNYKRVAVVWMDEYAEYIYKRRPTYRGIDPGDISKQVAIREKLKCKPFKWFMETVAFDLPKKYPPIEPPDFADGYIKSVNEPKLCVDSGQGGENKRIRAAKCSGSQAQQFKFTWHKDIRYLTSLCWDVSTGGDGAPIVFYTCHGGQGNQLWKYIVDEQQIMHVNSKRCLEIDVAERKVYVSQCSRNEKGQKWNIKYIDKEAMDKWDQI